MNLDTGYHAKIIRLKGEGYSFSSREGGGNDQPYHHDISTHKKMMHRFNKHCIENEGRKKGNIIDSWRKYQRVNITLNLIA